MGARLSLLAPSAPTVAISSYIDIFPSYKFDELLNNNRFLKTIKANDLSSGGHVIIKLFIKDSVTSLREITERLVRQQSQLSHLPNALPWSKLIETDRAGYLIRQSIKNNLYDRLSLRPFLSAIEKDFILFQILNVITSIHNLDIFHGDLKLENFVITSWNWVLLTDFAIYKPVSIPEDNPNQFSFYFDTSSRRICYLAPERFSNDSLSNMDALTKEMDLFSLGCVIAEFYSDGEPAFTLSQIFKYIKGGHQLNLSNIQNPFVKEIVLLLVTIDPKDRVDSDNILQKYHQTLFPDFFEFLYDFIIELDFLSSKSHSTLNDAKIDKIYQSFDKVSAALNLSFNEGNSSIPYKLNLPGMPPNHAISSNTIDNSNHPALLVLNLVFSMMKSVKQPCSKIKSCELILALSENLNDDIKLDRSLPYLCSIIDEFIDQVANQQDYSTKVVCAAISCITSLLMSCSYITPINVLVFPEYLLPRLSNLLLVNLPLNEKALIKVTLATCLPHLATSSKKYWMMAKSFKQDTLKSYQSKILGLSVDGGTNDYSNLNLPKDMSETEFESLASTLLTDSDVLVKISLVNNILPLCHFFGVDKTNDLILPHLITYLNDSSVELKIAFLNSIIKISGFIGILTFEQYVLPLLIQTISDTEPFIILKVLEIFNYVVSKRLINPRIEFNALGIYTELLESTTAYLLHPVEWIRQSVLCLVVSISENLTDADRYCVLYPLIKKFLKYDVSELSWNSLYPYLTKPLTRRVFDETILWANNASSKSLFWQQVLTSAKKTKSSKSNTLSFSNMGKSVYLPKNSHEISNLIANERKTKVSLSPEDRHWIFKLRSVGFEEDDLWKLYLLRDYFYHISKSKASESLNDQSYFKLVSENTVSPRNIFIDINYKTEPINTSKTIEASVETITNSEVASIQEFDSNGNSSLVLPSISRVKASIQTVQATAFGEMELSHDSSQFHQHSDTSQKENSLTRVLFNLNNSKVVTVNTRISYKGQNPYILNYLDNIDFEPGISNFLEFGNFIKSPKTNSELNSSKPSHIARIDTNHSNDWEIEGISHVVVSPSSEFFVTSSDTGTIKIWDSSRIDKLITSRNASLSINLESGITCIKFVPNRFVLAVGTMDGFIRLLKVDVVRGKNKKINKYSRLRLIRKLQLKQTKFPNYLLDFDFLITDKQTTLVGTSSNCNLLSIDLLRMSIIFEVQTNVFYGVPCNIIYGENSWVLIGTNKGVLFLWDFRFKVLIKSWKFEDKQLGKRQKIDKLLLKPKGIEGTSDFSFLIQTGGNITIWELPSFECKQVLTNKSVDSNERKFVLAEFNSKFELNNIEDVFSEYDINFEDQNEEGGNTAVDIYQQDKKLVVLSGGTDKEINVWDMLSYERSHSVTSSETRFTQSRKNGSTLIRECISKPGEIQYHKDIIRDLCYLSHPYDMVVSVDRSGLIQVFRC